MYTATAGMCPSDLCHPCRPGNTSWAHLSCALWIPEVRVGNAEKMEPITNVDVVPVSEWMHVCVCMKVNSTGKQKMWYCTIWGYQQSTVKFWLCICQHINVLQYSCVVLSAPQLSRRNLVCCLCRTRQGACIQCSVSTFEFVTACINKPPLKLSGCLTLKTRICTLQSSLWWCANPPHPSNINRPVARKRKYAWNLWHHIRLLFCNT